MRQGVLSVLRVMALMVGNVLRARTQTGGRQGGEGTPGVRAGVRCTQAHHHQRAGRCATLVCAQHGWGTLLRLTCGLRA